jgi:hypothetical protein
VTTFGEAFVEQRAADRLRPARQRRPVLARLGRVAALAAGKLSRTAVLSVSGFGFLSAGAWTLHVAAGLAAIGMSLLVLEYLSGDG